MTETSSDARSVLAAELDEFISSEYGKVLVKELFDLKKAKWAYFEGPCPHCEKQIRKKVQVEQPDWKGITAGIVALMDQGKGKPQAAPPPDPKVTEEQLRAAIREEVKALLAADQ